MADHTLSGHADDLAAKVCQRCMRRNLSSTFGSGSGLGVRSRPQPTTTEAFPAEHGLVTGADNQPVVVSVDCWASGADIDVTGTWREVCAYMGPASFLARPGLHDAASTTQSDCDQLIEGTNLLPLLTSKHTTRVSHERAPAHRRHDEERIGSHGGTKLLG